MQRKRGSLVPVAEVVSGLDGPVKGALQPSSRSGRAERNGWITGA